MSPAGFPSRHEGVQPSGHLTQADLVWLIPEVDVRLPLILDEVQQRFRAEWPDYAEFLAREQDEVRGAAREFLRQLIEIVEQPDSAPASPHDTSPQTLLFEEIGRVQWREGRDLTTLLSAYQVGARVAWHHVSAAALEVGAPPEALASLAEAVFIFVDQLSSASARGYVNEQTESSAAREQLRDELVELLLSGRADELAVRGAASRAGWPLPRVGGGDFDRSGQ